MAISIHVDAGRKGPVINKNIYGNFSEHLGRCIYGGVFVGKDSPIPNVNGMRTDVVEALKKLQLPVLRWPGGCFADEYHWQDGIGPQENRKRMVNTNWGGVVEDNSFGTHEFMELCRQVGCEPYVNMNVGSGTVREMAEWVEYLNSDGDSSVVQQRWANGQKDAWGVKYIGVGNENWGCGGNMEPEYYAHEFRRYQTYCRTYGKNRPYRIACGPSSADTHWTEVLMKMAGRYMDALTMHHYTVPTESWTSSKGSATDFDMDMYLSALRVANKMDEIIKGHLAVMDKYDPEHRVGLIVDEWGTWHDVEPGTNPGFLYQQNTMRDAMVAALTLNIFNSHADRVVMANIAQLVNVLQAVVLTDADQMVLTPTYHVFDLYRPHMDANLLESSVNADKLVADVKSVTASASVKDGVITVTAANLDAEKPAKVLLTLDGVDAAFEGGRVLAGEMHAMNTFEDKENVKPVGFTAVVKTPAGFEVELPSCSVAALSFRA